MVFHVFYSCSVSWFSVYFTAAVCVVVLHTCFYSCSVSWFSVCFSAAVCVSWFSMYFTAAVCHGFPCILQQQCVCVMVLHTCSLQLQCVQCCSVIEIHVIELRNWKFRSSVIVIVIELHFKSSNCNCISITIVHVICNWMKCKLQITFIKSAKMPRPPV